MPIGAIGAIGSSLIGALSAQGATNTQANAANAASAQQQTNLNSINQNLAPYLGAGNAGLSTLLTELGIPLAGYANVGSGAATGSFGSSPLTANPMYSSAYGGPALGAAPTLGSLQPLNLAPYNLPAFTQQQFQASPGYQYDLQQANQAVQAAATPGQGTLSGATLKALQSNAEGLANQDWYNALNTYTNNYNTAYGANNQNAINTNQVANQNTLNQFNATNQNYWNTYNAATNQQKTLLSVLQNLSGTGQNAAAQLGGFGSATASQIGQNTIGAGNALAAGRVGSANALTGGINALTAPNLNNGNSNNSLLSSLMALFNGGGPTSGNDNSVNQDFVSY